MTQVYTNLTVPYPAEIVQEAEPAYELLANVYFLSPYSTESQKTIIQYLVSNAELKAQK